MVPGLVAQGMEEMEGAGSEELGWVVMVALGSAGQGWAVRAPGVRGWVATDSED